MRDCGKERGDFLEWLGVEPCGDSHDAMWHSWRARAELAKQDRQKAQRTLHKAQQARQKALDMVAELEKQVGFVRAVKTPTNLDEARAMAIIGANWLAENAPDQLKNAATQQARVPDVAEPQVGFWAHRDIASIAELVLSAAPQPDHSGGATGKVADDAPSLLEKSDEKKQAQPHGLDRYVLGCELWLRKSTDEWVLEISGLIGNTDFTARHAVSSTVKPEDVAGLDHLYENRAEKVADYSEDVRGMVSSIIDLLADDAYAASFQTLGQYRRGLVDSLLAILEKQK